MFLQSYLYNITGYFRSSWLLIPLIISLLYPAKIYAQQTIHLAVGEWGPFVSEKLKYNGFFARIVVTAFEEADIKVKLHYYPWARAMLYAREGKFDGTFPWVLSDERRESFLFSDPVIPNTPVFFYLKSNNFEWKSYADLKGLRVGVTGSYDYGKAFHQAANAGLFQQEKVPTDELNFKKLLRGRIDLFPSNLYTGYSQIQQLFTTKQRLQITHHPKQLLNNSLFLILPKKNQGSAELLRAFNSGLKKLKASGRIEQYIRELTLNGDSVTDT